MIYTDKKPTSNDFSEKFEDYLQYDTIANLKKSFSLMGRRFVGQPRKAQIARGIAKYVREHPQDVLAKCGAETLMYIKKMLEMGKGSCITIDQPIVRGRQIQQMNLVLTYDDMYNLCTEFYMLDELHDIFSPHIDDAYKNPSPVLMDDMKKGLGDLIEIAKDCKTQEEFLAKVKEQFSDLDIDDDDTNKETSGEIDALLAEANKTESKGKSPLSMPYSFSMPLMDDIRKLHYKGQAATCKAFHQYIAKVKRYADSCFVKRFEEDYKDIHFDSLDDSLDNVYYCINDMDNAIHEIDLYDPMTFLDIAEHLSPVIKLSQNKWKI